MSLEQANAVEASSDLATGTPNAESSDLETRFAGILDPDNGPAPEADKPIEEAEQLADQPEEANEEAEVEDPDQDTPDPWAGYEDYEFDGKTYKIPTELKDGYLRQADYTRKTMAVSERERQVEARAQELQTQAARTEEEFNAAIALHQVTSALQQFGEIDWGSEFQKNLNDPLAYQELHARHVIFQDLLQKRQQIAGYLQHTANERIQAERQDTEKRLAETRDYAMKNIKGWTPDLDAKMTEWAVKQGLTREDLARAYNPLIYSILHKAYIGDQTLQRQQTAKPSQTASTAKTTTVSAKANPPASKDPAEMNEDEFFAYREAQLARRK